MYTYGNLTEVLIGLRKEEHKGITFINGASNDRFVSYSELYRRASHTLHALQRQGVHAGDEMILQTKDNESFLYVFWGCILGGIIPVPVTVGVNDEHKLKIFQIWETLKRPHIFADDIVHEELAEFAARNNLTRALERMKPGRIHISRDEAPGLGDIHSPRPEDIAFIQFSSGSTGSPKGITLTHANLLSNIVAILDRAKIDQNEISLSWMPLTHDMGMIGFHLAPLVANVQQCLMSAPLFIRRPLLWLKKASEYKVSVLSAPNFGYKYFLTHFKPEHARDWDLSPVKLIFNGAEPISADICNEFLACLKPCGLKRHTMYTVYGLAEASLAVAFPPSGEEFATICVDRNYVGIGDEVRETARENNGIVFIDEGYPVQDCNVRICDKDNNAVDKMVIGYIQIKGKNVTNGYYNDRNATLEAMTEDGWLNTGDLGFLRNGRLVVTGRVKEMIIVGGQNYYAHDLERLVEEVEGIGFGKVAVCGVHNLATRQDEVVVFIQFREKLEGFVPVTIDVKKHLNKKIGLSVKHIVPVKELIKTTSGKLERDKTRQEYLNGKYSSELQQISLWEEEARKGALMLPVSETEKYLSDLCREVLDRSDIGLDDNIMELGGNSIILTQVHARLEDKYAGRVKLSHIFTYPTIAKLAGFIDRGGAIDLPCMRLPEAYFHVADNTGSVLAHEFRLQGDLLKKLQGITAVCGTDMYNVLLSVYVFMLKKITNYDDITVQISGRALNQLLSLSISLQGIASFLALNEAVHSIRYQETDAYKYEVKDIDRINSSKDGNFVLPLFYNGNLLTDYMRFTDVFELVFAVCSQDTRVNIRCAYNARRLKEKSIRGLLNEYAGLLAAIAEQIARQ